MCGFCGRSRFPHHRNLVPGEVTDRHRYSDTRSLADISRFVWCSQMDRIVLRGFSSTCDNDDDTTLNASVWTRGAALWLRPCGANHGIRFLPPNGWKLVYAARSHPPPLTMRARSPLLLISKARSSLENVVLKWRGSTLRWMEETVELPPDRSSHDAFLHTVTAQLELNCTGWGCCACKTSYHSSSHYREL